MSNICSIKVSSPPRGLTPGVSAVFVPAEAVVTWSWGLQPATALIDWVSAVPQPAIVAGSSLEIDLGGHVFYGITDNFVWRQATDGFSTMQEFLDNRWFLQKDVIYAQFNLPDSRIINGVYQKRYKHLLPPDFNANNYTFTTTPYTAQQVLDYCFGASTVQSPWLRGYHSAMANPVYDLDYSSGQKLGQVLVDVSEKLGLVFTLQGGPYTLVWALKGEGALPGFPANSDNRRTGTALSDNPTRVRILGDRNRYQVLNCALVPDWLPAFQAFWNFGLFVDDIFFNEALDAALTVGQSSPLNVPAGTRYNAVPGDPDGVIGYQLASARAKSMTVAQYALLRDARASADGNAFRDYRRVQGRSRLQLPVALYLAQLLFRAFKLPDSFTVQAGNGLLLTRWGYDLDSTPVVEVTHDPVTGWLQPRLDSGGNYMVPSSEHNGYAIIQGYQVAQDAFGTLNPDYFDYQSWISAQSLWQYQPYQFDDSGEGTQFILFDDVVINSGDLITLANQVPSGQWLATLNANPTFVTPPVKAALTFLGDRFSWVQGDGQLDDVSGVSGLSAEYLTLAPAALPQEQAYADGLTASNKAAAYAALLLNRQLYYQAGGYVVQGSDGQTLTGTVDRVTLRWSASNGLTQEVDFTNERSRNVAVNAFGTAVLQLEPERAFDRRAQLDGLFPGQEQLKTQARQERLAAAMLRANFKLENTLVNTFHLLMGLDAPPLTVFTSNLGGTDATTLAAGTPLFRDANKKTAWMPDDLADPQPEATPIFLGVTTLDGQAGNGGVKATATGAGNVVQVRLLLNDDDAPPVGTSVGFPSDYVPRTVVELSPSFPIGTLLDDWSKNQTSRVVLTRVLVGSAAGGGYRGEYDQTKTYAAGEEFSVSVPTTIAGIQVSAGLYAVPPAGTDGLGTWAGTVPANPTGNAVPQDPLPIITTAPNNVWYARLVAGYCT